MIIQGIEFPFSALNANDTDRMKAATRQAELDSNAEKLRVQQGAITDISEVIRGQCRIVHTFLESILGPGSCEKLGLDGNNLNSYRKVTAEIDQQIAAELASLHKANVPIKTNATTSSPYPKQGKKSKKKKGKNR